MFQNKSLYPDSFGLNRQELNFVVNNFAAERASKCSNFHSSKKKKVRKKEKLDLFGDNSL